MFEDSSNVELGRAEPLREKQGKNREFSRRKSGRLLTVRVHPMRAKLELQTHESNFKALIWEVC